MRSYKEIYEDVSTEFEVNYISLVKRLEDQEEKVSNLSYSDTTYEGEESILVNLESEYDVANEKFFRKLEQALNKELKEEYIPNESDEFAGILFAGAKELCENLSNIEYYYVKLLSVYNKLTNSKGF
jgi:hypothetical protein